MSQQPKTGQFMRAAAWLQYYDLFRTRSSLDWFIRTHREELINAGELIVRGGSGGMLLGPGFYDLALDIMRRESRQQLRAGA